MEFLYTKDPSFFNKVKTEDLSFRFRDGNVKLAYRVLKSGSPHQKQRFKALAPYEDNDSKCFCC